MLSRAMVLICTLFLMACQAPGQTATGPPSLQLVPVNYYKYRSYVIPGKKLKGRRSEPSIVVVERERVPSESKPSPEPPPPPPRKPGAGIIKPAEASEGTSRQPTDEKFDEIQEVIDHAKATVRDYYGNLNKRGRYEDTGR